MPQPQEIPSRAQVVVIGGGIVGCSVAYHLALRGLTDVVLLERKQLTCGTTWHAAGLVGQLRATHNLTRLAQYTAELYAIAERERGRKPVSGASARWRSPATEARFEELKRGASMARCFGLEVNVLTPQQAYDLWPLMTTDDLVGAVHLPKDGQTNPVDTTQALAKAARGRGARIIENVKVTGIVLDRGARGRRAHRGRRLSRRSSSSIAPGCGRVSSAASVGAAVPLHAAEHFYIVTEPIRDLPRRLPVLRDGNACAYFKEDAGKLLVGWFEPIAKPWGMNGIPDSFSFDQLPDRSRSHRAAARERRSAACRCSAKPVFSCSSTARKASRRTTATCSARPRRSATCSLPPASTRSASNRRAAPARCWPTGSPTVIRRWICGTSTSAAACRSSATRRYLQGSDRRGAGAALCDALAVPPAGDRARRAALRAA